jgi:hypothetical protein
LNSLIVTVARSDDASAFEVARLFRSVDLLGGAMAAFDRCAYFVGGISHEAAERLAQHAVVLKFVDSPAHGLADVSLIAALLDEEETGFIIAVEASQALHSDVSEWVRADCVGVMPHPRGALGVRLAAGSDDFPASMPLYETRALLIPRDIARDFASAWLGGMRVASPGLSGRDLRATDMSVDEWGLSIAISRCRLKPVPLPPGLITPNDSFQAESGGADAASERDQHQAPEFDNRAFWNERYRNDPQRGSGLGSRGAPRALKESLIQRSIESTGAASILDVGCGDLASVAGLSSATYVGIDISEEVVRANQVKRPDWVFLCGDFVQLSRSHALRADLVLCFDVLIHQHEFAAYEAFVFRLVQCCGGTGLIGAFQTPPRAQYRSEITAFHEPITRTLARAGAKEIRVIASYRDTVVAQFRTSG